MVKLLETRDFSLTNKKNACSGWRRRRWRTITFKIIKSGMCPELPWVRQLWRGLEPGIYSYRVMEGSSRQKGAQWSRGLCLAVDVLSPLKFKWLVRIDIDMDRTMLPRKFNFNRDPTRTEFWSKQSGLGWVLLDREIQFFRQIQTSCCLMILSVVESGREPHSRNLLEKPGSRN